MAATTKTGLQISPRRQIQRSFRCSRSQNLLPCAISKQATLSLRPFGGIYNPYISKGCSIFCNHPAPNEVKNVVRMAKNAWAHDGRSGKSPFFLPQLSEHDHDHIPEDLFRRYTDTDSRPLTPAPTIASARTRASIGGTQQSARRCVTPDPQTVMDVNERKQLILDLRRSHSQETLYWNASSDQTPSQVANALLLTQDLATKDGQSPTGLEKIPSESDVSRANTPICMNDRDDGEEDGMRRCGRKLKKAKPSTNTFKPSQEPETQVAQYTHVETPVPSARHSLVPGKDMPPMLAKQTRTADWTIEDSRNKSIFLDETSLRLLRRGLNVDLMEEVFNRTKKRALQETFRATAIEKLEIESKAIQSMKRTLNLPEVDHDKWLNLPRKYRRYATRFELPMDAKEFLTLTPLTYLARYVFIASNLKQLYHRVFIKYLPEEATQSLLATTVNNDDSDSENGDPIKAENRIKEVKLIDRKLNSEILETAMQEVLGFHGTSEKISEIRVLLEFDTSVGTEIEVTFRLWCGLVAFSERFLNTLSHEEDPRHEIEMVDFEALDRKIKAVPPSEALLRMLKLIKGD